MQKIDFLDLPVMRGASGTVPLPGSKSISNRVLLLAGLSSGTTVIHDLLASDDTAVMLDALRALGCTIQADEQVVHVTGLAGQLKTKQADLFLGNAGTAMRPLTAVLAILAATQEGLFSLRGVPRMHERPIADLVDALRALGCQIDYLGEPSFPPLQLRTSAQPLNTAAPLRVRGDVSSQFLTALLLALPLISEQADVVIEVQGALISKPYVDITLNLLARFGIQVQRQGWQRFVIPQGSRYQSPGDVHVEGDASSASYFIALGAIAATDKAVRIEGVGAASIQGDIEFVAAARAMGANVLEGPNWLEVKRGRWPLTAITLNCNRIPDAAMTLAVMALYAEGTTTLTDIASWRVKETDRIAAMAAELRKLGASVLDGHDFISVTPPTPTAWKTAAINTYDDHRMAMCFSLAAFNALAGATPPVPVRILDPQCVVKTFPGYFAALFSVASTATSDIPVLTVDGPSASGKGTLASQIAQKLGWHFLDSGAVYRATAWVAMQAKVDESDEVALAQLASGLPLTFLNGGIQLDGIEVREQLRREDVGALASKISALGLVRSALLELQLSFRKAPGLVADGRDMGTVIFPDAKLKIFLTASAATRAQRRHKQLIDNGFSANIDNLRADLEARDARDQNRSVAPLRPAQDAVLLDNSTSSVEASMDVVLKYWTDRLLAPQLCEVTV